MCRQASSIPSQLKHSEEERKSSLLGYHIRPNSMKRMGKRKMEHLVVGKITEEKADYTTAQYYPINGAHNRPTSLFF
jgi:hypothetical protein